MKNVIVKETFASQIGLDSSAGPTRGKVRDIYDLGNALLIVTTDRISAFDVVMAKAVLNKGLVLNQLSDFWFSMMKDLVPNHILNHRVEFFPPPLVYHSNILKGRAIIVLKAEPFKIECVVRGYMSGSGWEEYQKTGMICGIELPPGMVESERFPQPIFTPATKAPDGEHDENITFERACQIVGSQDLVHQMRDISVAIYERARDFAEKRGIIIADTKLEYGLSDGKLILIDELLTPDSSRFWPKDEYQPGGPQKSFDKQFLRDYLKEIGWNKQPPPPELPRRIIDQTGEKYVEAFDRLTGRVLIC